MVTKATVKEEPTAEGEGDVTNDNTGNQGHHNNRDVAKPQTDQRVPNQ